MISICTDGPWADGQQIQLLLEELDSELLWSELAPLNLVGKGENSTTKRRDKKEILGTTVMSAS